MRRHVVWVLLLAELGAVPDHPLVRRACEFTVETMQRSDGAFPRRWFRRPERERDNKA